MVLVMGGFGPYLLHEFVSIKGKINSGRCVGCVMGSLR